MPKTPKIHGSNSVELFGRGSTFEIEFTVELSSRTLALYSKDS
jgi:hypothetical protein